MCTLVQVQFLFGRCPPVLVLHWLYPCQHSRAHTGASCQLHAEQHHAPYCEAVTCEAHIHCDRYAKITAEGEAELKAVANCAASSATLAYDEFAKWCDETSANLLVALSFAGFQIKDAVAEKTELEVSVACDKAARCCMLAAA
eukprot:2083060-Amphidinium_carterae.2